MTDQDAPRPIRQQFRYLGCTNGEMAWESVRPVPGTSQHEVVVCDWEWFWGEGRG